MKRKIVQIDQDKCNGCGLCVNACHEGAIELRDGKAVLISDEYCDGLGNCLPECPTGAIEITERDAAEYSEEAVEVKKALENAQPNPVHSHPFTCPGSMAKIIKRKSPAVNTEVPGITGTDESAEVPGPVHSCCSDGTALGNADIDIKGRNEKGRGIAEETRPRGMDEKAKDGEMESELSQWPVQLRLINPSAGYLKGADILVAADCTAYAYANFHRDFIRGHIVFIACPKLDDNQYNTEKFTEILSRNNIRSLTVVRMEVPCCGGIVQAVKKAMLQSGEIVPYHEVIIGTDGTIVESR